VSQYIDLPRIIEFGVRTPLGGEILRTRPDWLWSSPSVYRVSFLGGQNSRCMALTIYHHIAQKLKKE